MIKAANELEKQSEKYDSKDTLTKGIHILADIYEVSAGREEMLDADRLRSFTNQAVDDAGLTRVGESFVQFPGAGVTGVVLLAESHIAIHTWPEKDYLSLDIFVCNVDNDNTGKARSLYRAFKNLFQAGNTHYQEIERD